MATNVADIDLQALQAEISGLSEDTLREQLLEIRTRQKVQQKKYQNTDAQKAYRKKVAEGRKLMAERAKATPATRPGFANLYAQIVAEAEEAASAKLAEAEADQDELGA